MLNVKTNGWNLGTGLNPHIIGMLGTQAGVISIVNQKTVDGI
jgi:hypothetical protein